MNRLKLYLLLIVIALVLGTLSYALDLFNIYLALLIICFLIYAATDLFKTGIKKSKSIVRFFTQSRR